MGRLGPLNSSQSLDLREYPSSKRKLHSDEIFNVSPSRCEQVGCKLVTVHCCLGSIPTKLGEGLNDHTPQRPSVFDRLSKTSKRRKSLKKSPSQDSELFVATNNMTSRGKPQPRRRQGVVIAPEDSSDSDYSPGLSQTLIN